MKMNWKRTITICLALCMLFTLASCTRGGTPAPSADPNNSEGPAAQKVVWRVGHNNAEDHYWNIYLTRFAELVAEKTDGQIDVQVYPSSQLGDDNALGEMIRNGNIEMMITGGCIPGKWYRPMMMAEMAGLFDNAEHVARCIDPESEPFRLMAEGCAKENIMLWTCWERTGFEFMTTFPVISLDDLKNHKLRVTGDEIWIAHMEGTYGINATPMAFSEVFTSLSQGVVEGVLNPISSMYTMRFNEVCDNLVITGQNADFAPILVSPQQWAKLTAEQQAVMQECMDQVTAEVSEYISTEDDIYIELMKEANPNLAVTYLDGKEVQQAALQIHSKVVDLCKGQELYDAIRALADE